MYDKQIRISNNIIVELLHCLVLFKNKMGGKW